MSNDSGGHEKPVKDEFQESDADSPSSVSSETAHLTEALRSSQERLAFIMQAADFGAWDWDLNTNSLEWSPRCRELFGLAPETEITYQVFLDSIYPEDRLRINRAVEAALHGNEEYFVEMRVIPPEGGLRWVASRGKAFRDQEGKALRMTGVVFDISKQKHIEQALRESEIRFRALVEQAADAIFLHNEEGKFIDVNRRACENLGFSREELLQMSVMDIERDLDLPTAQAAWRKIMPGESHTLYGRQCRKDGTQFPIEARVSTCYIGEQRLYIGVVRDITVQKRAEQTLIQSEKLASAGRMAATVAHEINNPLESLTNLLYLASTTPGLPSSAQHYLDMANEELKHVAHITQKSLGFYRESNTPELVSITSVLSSAVDLLQRKIKERSAIVKQEWRVRADLMALAGELRQVFSNLLANSLDAIDTGGTILIRITSHNEYGRDLKYVRVSIADNGCGISPSVLPHIFEPFFTTKGTIGTGLGLWVSQQIIKKHGGVIQLRSSAQGARRGAVFSVLLPAVEIKELASKLLP